MNLQPSAGGDDVLPVPVWAGPAEAFPAPRPGPKLVDRYIGCLIGGAIGDALGRPAEGRPAAALRERYPSGLTDFQPWHGWTGGPTGTFTDDTQLSLVIAGWLVDAGASTAPAEDLVDRLRAWLPQGRGIGSATREAVARLLAGEPWWQAGTPSAGNGEAMRAAPIGLRFAGLPDETRQTARVATLPTHRDPTAVASAIVQAVAVQLCLAAPDGAVDPEAFLHSVSTSIADLDLPALPLRSDPSVRRTLRQRIGEVTDWLDAPIEAVVDHFYNGAFVLETTPVVLWSLCRYADDPERGLVEVVMRGRDADTNAAMLSNLLGALHGPDAFPDRWRGAHLEAADELQNLATALYRLRWPDQPAATAATPVRVARERPSTTAPGTKLRLTGAQADRAAGVLLATACGDALGAGYEFGPPLPADSAVGMVGGGGFGWAPGEWTDDTSMAIAIAEVAATGADLRTPAALDAIAARWAGWAREAKDVGVQTRAVLSAAGPKPNGAALADAAALHHARTGRSGGNGSLMRTAPVALAYLHDPDGLIEAAHAVSALTHFDPEAGEACALWCLAIRHAVLNGTFDGLRAALDTLPADRAAVWAARLDEAKTHPPAHFTRNGWVVQALQAAWSAISHTPVPDDNPAGGVFAAQHLQYALESAVRGGNDTDTIAAIAGGLLGARWGVSAVPAAWRRIVHGWPGLRGRDLIRLGLLAAREGQDDGAGWPSIARFDYTGFAGHDALAVHPYDPGVWLGGIDALRALPDGVDAVVSLCRLGTLDAPATGVAATDHLEVWLIDSDHSAANPNLDFVLHDTAQAVEQLRAEGRTVLVHCVQSHSRTPTVAALHAVRQKGVPLDEALVSIRHVLPAASPNATFRTALGRLLPPVPR